MNKRLLLGAHCSIAKGYHQALETAHLLETNCLQMFVKNQRQWQMPSLDEHKLILWQETRNKFKNKITHIIAHASYLINLASDNTETRKRSKISLRQELQRAQALNINRYVLHPGNHKGQGLQTGIKLIANAINEIMPDFPDITILLETTAGAGTSIGSKIEQIAEIINKSECPENLGCCLDTCHLFVSGYDLSASQAFDSFIEKLDTLLGLNKIGCIHINDSVGQFCSHLDRHWHIGEGNIPLRTFQHIMNHKKLINIPKIIETPKSPTTIQADKKNLQTLRNLIKT